MKTIFILFYITALSWSCSLPEEEIVNIRWGEDTCFLCKMIVSDKRFAGVIVTKDELFIFDDIGELLDFYTSSNLNGKVFVSDYFSEKLVDAEIATFVLSDIPTPMGYGVVAFLDRSKAVDFADNRYRYFNFSELVERWNEVKK